MSVADESIGEPSAHGCFSLKSSDGQKDGSKVEWRVEVELHADLVDRKVWRDGRKLEQGSLGWEPEGLIWPTWPGKAIEETTASVSPLSAVEDYWSAAGKRLRDSAKWMSTALGAALAAIVGTSPLTETRARTHQPHALILGSLGLIFLFLTLFLVLQVMRPQSVSFADVQHAKYRPRTWQKLFLGNALYKWKTIIKNEQDLHLQGACEVGDCLSA